MDLKPDIIRWTGINFAQIIGFIIPFSNSIRPNMYNLNSKILWEIIVYENLFIRFLAPFGKKIENQIGSPPLL